MTDESKDAPILTVAELHEALRLGGAESSVIERGTQGLLQLILNAGIARVESYAPDAPDDVKKQAAIMFCGYLYDSDGRTVTPNDFMLSGAKSLLAPWQTDAIPELGAS